MSSVIFNGGGASKSSGTPSPENSTQTPLGADGTYTGEWVSNNDPQVGYSFQADQDGTLFLDFSRNGGETIQTVRRYELTAGEVGRFDALVKGAGRSFRLRYENGPVAQTEFEILAFTGDGLYPFAQSSRDAPVVVTYSATVSVGDVYGILVDLSDKVSYPHNDTGSIDLHSSFVFADKASNTVGVLQFGVVTRIDAISADIDYVQGVSFNNSSDRQIVRDRTFNTPFRLGQENGNLTKVLTLFKATNVTAVNTATPIPSARGIDTIPALGDIIVRYGHTSGGSFTGAVTIQYAGNVSTT